jgi:hypothetical protein
MSPAIVSVNATLIRIFDPSSPACPFLKGSSDINNSLASQPLALAGAL